MQLRRSSSTAEVVVVGLVEHRSRMLSIVLLICTHGINLGRTQFHKGVRGQLAELLKMLLEWTGVERRR